MKTNYFLSRYFVRCASAAFVVTSVAMPSFAVECDYTAENLPTSRVIEHAPSAEGNTVSVSGVGGKAQSLYGASTKEADASASGNQVSLTDSGLQNVYGGYVNAAGTADNNQVTVENLAAVPTSSWVKIIGGAVNGSGSASGNKVTIANSVIRNLVTVYAGLGASSASASTGDVKNNTVHLKNVDIADGISAHIYGGFTYKGDSEGNTVILENVRVGMSDVVISGGNSLNGTILNNNVIIIGNNNDLTYASIVGAGDGFVNSEAGDGSNTLTLQGFQGTVGNIGNFDNINVTLQDWDPSKAVLTTTYGDISGTNVRVDIESIAADADVLSAGSALNLFGGSLADDEVTVETGNVENVKHGSTVLYDFKLDVRDGEFVLVAEKVRVNPQLKALSEGRIAAMTLNNNAADLVAGQGVSQAAFAAAPQSSGKDARLAAFVALSGGHTRVDSGSHVNVDGLSALVGVSGSMLKARALVLGGFVESGWGQYTTHNSFDGMASVRGTGESSYGGCGLLMRYSLAASGYRPLSGFSVDASLRTGRQALDFGSFTNEKGIEKYAGYDINSPYIAGHAGVSYRFEPVQTVQADLFARYLWSHLGGDSAFIQGKKFHFESMESHRFRLGGLVSWALSNRWRPYVSLAYDWECSGSARSQVHGVGIEAPGMRGGSFIGEIGTSFQPSPNRPLWLNAGVQGYVGKQSGCSASVGCSVAF